MLFDTPLFLMRGYQLIGLVLLFQAVQVVLTYLILKVIRFFN